MYAMFCRLPDVDCTLFGMNVLMSVGLLEVVFLSLLLHNLKREFSNTNLSLKNFADALALMMTEAFS